MKYTRNKDYKIKTIKEIRESFRGALYGELKTEFEQQYKKTKRQNEYSTNIRVAFCDYVDYLQDDGLISEKLSRRATL
jgi:hypothetical protein